MKQNICIIQNSPFLDKTKNIEQTKKLIAENAENDLVIFPELSLNGYLAMDAFFDNYFTEQELCELFANTACDVIVSCALLQEHQLYNSAVYLSSGQIKHIHCKNHLPNYTFFEEARFFTKGNKIRSFDSPFGKLAMLICEDLWHPKTFSRLNKLKVDMVIILSSSPTREIEEKLKIEEKWNHLLSTLAILNQCHVLFANRVGFEDGLGFWGGSRVISPTSETIHQAKLFEEDKIQFAYEKIQNTKYLFEKYKNKDTK